MSSVPKRLLELSLIFLKLGFISFGGPAAHIAIMEEEVVKKRKWMTREHFLDLIGVTNLIPGPNSAEMTMHCGYERAGFPGLVVAGLSFILPAVAITGLLAYLYQVYGQVPALGSFFYGIKPAILAIILQAVYKLGLKAVKNFHLAVIGILVVVASLLGVNEITAILGAGVVGLLLAGLGSKNPDTNIRSVLPFLFLNVGTGSAATVTGVSLFLVFFKIGAVLFGSGYVLVAYLDAELVERLGWLTKSQLLDAIAIGQFTPGPILSSVTFIGYQLKGVQGALMATAGVFLPAFLFVAIINPLVPRIRNSLWAAGFLDAVNVGAVAVMLTVTYYLGAEILIDWKSWLIAVSGAAVCLLIKKVNVVWIVAGGAAGGYLLNLM